jgi:hypothetical protein
MACWAISRFGSESYIEPVLVPILRPLQCCRHGQYHRPQGGRSLVRHPKCQCISPVPACLFAGPQRHRTGVCQTQNPALKGWGRAFNGPLKHRICSRKTFARGLHIPHKRQLTKLVRHVHAVAHHKFIRTHKATEVRFDVGGKMTRFFQQHSRHNA